MVSITIKNINAAKALELVNELKTLGLIINVDFEWAYYNEQILYDLHRNEIKPRYCEFKFRDAKLATFYSLKWQTYIR